MCALVHHMQYLKRMPCSAPCDEPKSNGQAVLIWNSIAAEKQGTSSASFGRRSTDCHTLNPSFRNTVWPPPSGPHTLLPLHLLLHPPPPLLSSHHSIMTFDPRDSIPSTAIPNDAFRIQLSEDFQLEEALRNWQQRHYLLCLSCVPIGRPKTSDC